MWCEEGTFVLCKKGTWMQGNILCGIVVGPSQLLLQ